MREIEQHVQHYFATSEKEFNYKPEVILEKDLLCRIILDVNLGIPLSELKVSDLLFYNDEPIRRGVGVYVFKSDDKVFYVGNCFARHFVERIPPHLDSRRSAWMNSLVKTIVTHEPSFKVNGKYDKTNEERSARAAQFAFSNLKLVLINFEKTDKDKINNLERVMGHALQSYNTYFRKMKIM